MNKSYLLLPSLVLGTALVGCAPERHEAIPPTAMLAVEGTRSVTFTAPSAGTVYVYNATNGRMLYNARVSSRDVVVVDPDADKIMLNGRPAYEGILDRGNEFKVFFDDTERDESRSRTTVERTTTVERE